MRDFAMGTIRETGISFNVRQDTWQFATRDGKRWEDRRAPELREALLAVRWTVKFRRFHGWIYD